MVLGDPVRVFEVQTTPEGAVTGVVSELDQSQLAVAAVGNSIAIVPVVPLKESTDYAVVATNGIVGINELPLRGSFSFGLTAGSIELTGPAAALEPLRQITNTILSAAESQGVDRDTVVQAWSFKTQSITPVMEAVKSVSVAAPVTVVPTGSTTKSVNESLPGIADIYVGTIELPYYRTVPSGTTDLAGISSFWQTESGGQVTRNTSLPHSAQTVTVPLLMTLPNESSQNTMPAEGWPIAIFVHGVLGNRTNMLPLADAMAQAGYAMIAIDQPMHGITDSTSALSAAQTPFEETERTFDLDFVTQDPDTGEVTAESPDGVPDSSGRYYYSPRYLLAGRDNLRQAAADLFVLSASVANIPGINAARKTLIAHSLGGTVGTTFLAFDNTINAATMAMPAAGLVGTLLNGFFREELVAGLQAAGLNPGTAEFQQFLVAAQTVIDSGDAINFGTQAAQNAAIHMIEVIGDGTVPNNVPGSPLVGTDPLARLMGLASASETTTESAIVRFTAGGHSSILIPQPAENPSLEATVEMQTQTATFAATDGGVIQITNTGIIQ